MAANPLTKPSVGSTTRSLPNDTLWKKCASIDVSSWVTDTAWKAVVGVWVQAGDSKGKQLFGPRVKTDSVGFFRVMVDPKHTTIYMFDDSNTTNVDKSIAANALSIFDITDCVVSPVILGVMR